VRHEEMRSVSGMANEANTTAHFGNLVLAAVRVMCSKGCVIL
jgi:hypothetical protein